MSSTGAFFVGGASSAIFGTPSFKFNAGSSGTVACVCAGSSRRFVRVFLSTTISSANLNFGVGVGAGVGLCDSGLASAAAAAFFWMSRFGRPGTVASNCGSGSGGLGASAAGGDGSGAAGVAVCCGSDFVSGAAGMFLTGPVDSVLVPAGGFGFSATGAGLSGARSGSFTAGIFGVVAFNALDFADCLGFATGAGGALPGSMPNTSTATS